MGGFDVIFCTGLLSILFSWSLPRLELEKNSLALCLRVGVFLVASQALSGWACSPSHTPSLGSLPQETVWGGGSSGTWAGGSWEVGASSFMFWDS